MLTPVWYLRIIFYPRVLQWVQRITKKSYKLKFIQNTPFQYMPKYGQIRPKVNFWQEGRRDSIFLPKWSE